MLHCPLSGMGVLIARRAVVCKRSGGPGFAEMLVSYAKCGSNFKRIDLIERIPCA